MLTLIVLQLCHRAWALATSYFYTDDYVLLAAARDRGLTGDYLMEPYNSHLMPGTRLLYWLVEASGRSTGAWPSLSPSSCRRPPAWPASGCW